MFESQFARTIKAMEAVDRAAVETTEKRDAMIASDNVAADDKDEAEWLELFREVVAPLPPAVLRKAAKNENKKVR